MADESGCGIVNDGALAVAKGRLIWIGPADRAGEVVPESRDHPFVEKMIDEVAEKKLATAVDAFCETITITPKQIERVSNAAADYGQRVVQAHAGGSLGRRGQKCGPGPGAV